MFLLLVAAAAVVFICPQNVSYLWGHEEEKKGERDNVEKSVSTDYSSAAASKNKYIYIFIISNDPSMLFLCLWCFFHYKPRLLIFSHILLKI